MSRFEVTFRKFAILSGVLQDGGDYAICVQPPTASLQRRGTLMLMSEPAGLNASFGVEACRVAQAALIEHYYGEHSLSLTSGLINALDSANNTLLQYNYEKVDDSNRGGQGGAVAVQGGGVGTKKARVGLTAVLVRPDGTGVYIAQTAPAQLYIIHNGLLTAIPQSDGWQTQQAAPVLIAEIDEQDEQAHETEEGHADEEEVPVPAFQAAPLGSRPGVEADLLFRRVDAGDLLVAVSSSLTRRIDQATADRLFPGGDADTIIEALHNMAIDLGIAEAHACVLQLGTDSRSGVETDFRSPLHAPKGEQVARNGGANFVPAGALEQRANDLKTALNGPRQWLSRRHNDGVPALDATDTPASNSLEGSKEDSEPGNPKMDTPPSAFPTDPLLNRSIDRPPFQGKHRPSVDEAPIVDEELEFDGWEDTPPALSLVGEDYPGAGDVVESSPGGRIIIKPTGATDRPQTSGSGALQRSPYKVPTLFELTLDDDDGSEEEASTGKPSIKAGNRSPLNLAGAGKQIFSIIRTALSNLAPERQSTTGQSTDKNRPILVPGRVLIAAGVVILSVLLLASIVTMAGKSRAPETANLLQQAKQEELLANQPNVPDTERRLRLANALVLAKQALAANPALNEAQLLVTNIQSEIDKSEGITRLTQVKLLFDLDTNAKSSKSPSAGVASAPEPVQIIASTSITTGITAKKVVVQGNDAFIFDAAAQKIYRCKIAAQTCTAALSSGESIGNRKVGKITNLAARVTNVIALDDALVAFVFEPDTNTWQSQPLGDASKLQQPKDIATYDGNLYLLAAKQSQISKYASGKYGEVPEDWIKEPASVSQVKEPVAMAIDGVIYVMLADGKIVALQAGKVMRTISPKATTPAAAPTDLFTGTDVRDLYLLRASEGSISRISKEGQTLAILKAPASNADLAKIEGMTVDEGRGKLYLVSGGKVYEAQLPGPSINATSSEKVTGAASQPTVRPTAEP